MSAKDFGSSIQPPPAITQDSMIFLQKTVSFISFKFLTSPKFILNKEKFLPYFIEVKFWNYFLIHIGIPYEPINPFNSKRLQLGIDIYHANPAFFVALH